MMRYLIFMITAIGVCICPTARFSNAEDLEARLIKVYEAARPSVVMITTRHLRNLEGQSVGLGQQRSMPSISPEFVSATYSGIVYDTEGRILTVASAVQNADRIEVTTWDGRHLKADPVGADDRSGLGMIRVSDSTLKPIPLADSSQIKVGTWIAVIGNPFGLQGTLSHGIVSGLGRRIVEHGGHLTNMIQITAPINPGDVGAPVLDLQGRLVGVVHATLGRAPSIEGLREFLGEGRQWIGWGTPESTMSAEGINFAMPINDVKPLADQLARTGTVTRGWIGIQVANLPESSPAAAVGGVLVKEVIAGSPAQKADIRAHDHILSVNGQPVKDADHLANVISHSAIGSSLQLSISRGGRQQNVMVTVSQAPKTQEAYKALLKDMSPFWRQGARLGVLVQDISPDMAEYLRVNRGALVVSVLPGSAAERAGVRSQDVIIGIGGEPINSASDVRRAVANPKLGQAFTLDVYRNGEKKTLQVELDKL